MTDACENIKKIKVDQKRLVYLATKYFSPLRKRYVTKAVIRKKWWGRTKNDTIQYTPLSIEFSLGIFDNRQYFYVYVNTDIIMCNNNHIREKDKCVSASFLVSLFNGDFETINKDENVQAFLLRIHQKATPKYEKYESLLSHITDEDIKFEIADKIENYMTSESFRNSVDETNSSYDKLIDYVKTSVYEIEQAKNIENQPKVWTCPDCGFSCSANSLGGPKQYHDCKLNIPKL